MLNDIVADDFLHLVEAGVVGEAEGLTDDRTTGGVLHDQKQVVAAVGAHGVFAVGPPFLVGDVEGLGAIADPTHLVHRVHTKSVHTVDQSQYSPALLLLVTDLLRSLSLRLRKVTRQKSLFKLPHARLLLHSRQLFRVFVYLLLHRLKRALHLTVRVSFLT